MKHNPRILAIMIVLFLATQYVGLWVVNSYIDYSASATTGNFTATPLPMVVGQEIERPQIDVAFSPIYLILAVLIGTVVLFLVMRMKPIVWKLWFFLSVSLCVYFSLFAFLKNAPSGALIAGISAAILAALKTWKPSLIAQNVTELLLYGGLVSVLFSIVNIWTMVVLLILISLYDAYAVWKSKHMVTLAKAQTKTGLFAGLMIPYQNGKIVNAKPNLNAKKGAVQLAVLGGGDMGFPLLFAASVLKEFALTGQGWLALLIPPFAAIALLGLLIYGQKGKFYPAMPFISAGCFVGLGVVFLVKFLV